MKPSSKCSQTRRKAFMVGSPEWKGRKANRGPAHRLLHVSMPFAGVVVEQGNCTLPTRLSGLIAG